MNSKFAQEFADHWIKAWNSHDLNEILSHYTDDFEMSSPIIVERMGVDSGVLKGKEAVGEYWAIGLKNMPDLHFELLNFFTGSNSLILYYKGHKGYSSEFFQFNEKGKVFKAAAHYE